MSDVSNLSYENFTLPSSVVSRIDISRLVREFERVDNELTALSVREKIGAEGAARPALSEQLSDFLEKNKLSLSDDGRERSHVLTQLRRLKDHAPSIHMTFATTADGESLQSLADWLRGSVHPQAVISVGVQPALIGGVHIRTTNHVYDLSLREQLKNGRPLIVKEMEALRVNG